MTSKLRNKLKCEIFSPIIIPFVFSFRELPKLYVEKPQKLNCFDFCQSNTGCWTLRTQQAGFGKNRDGTAAVTEKKVIFTVKAQDLFFLIY